MLLSDFEPSLVWILLLPPASFYLPSLQAPKTFDRRSSVFLSYKQLSNIGALSSIDILCTVFTTVPLGEVEIRRPTSAGSGLDLRAKTFMI